MTKEIGGDSVVLRRFRESDFETYRSFVNDPEIARRIDRAGTVSRDEHAAWCAALVNSQEADVFAVTDTTSGDFLGLVWLYDIHPRHRRAEVRIVMGRGQGRGLGSETLGLLARHAFERGLQKLWADVLEFNKAAVRAFEKAGFVREGLLRSDRATASGRTDVIRFGLVPRDQAAERESAP